MENEREKKLNEEKDMKSKSSEEKPESKEEKKDHFAELSDDLEEGHRDSLNDNNCFFCKMGREKHSPTFTCLICYTNKKESSKTETKCINNCFACRNCIESSITAQFEQARIKDFKCICGGDNFKDELIESLLSPEQVERLARLRESREIDQDPNSIRCPKADC